MSNVIKVGVFATLSLIILAVLIWKIEDLNFFRSEGRRISAEFATVAGLDEKAPVRVAGVRVGRVDAIRLDGRSTCPKARSRASRASACSATSTSSSSPDLPAGGRCRPTRSSPARRRRASTRRWRSSTASATASRR
jgi:hypothetical protein